MQPLYDLAAAAIRDVDQQHLIFFESVVRVACGVMSLHPLALVTRPCCVVTDAVESHCVCRRRGKSLGSVSSLVFSTCRVAQRGPIAQRFHFTTPSLRSCHRTQVRQGTDVVPALLFDIFCLLCPDGPVVQTTTSFGWVRRVALAAQ